MRATVIVGCVVVGASLVPATALAQSNANFGGQGQLAISTDAQLSFQGQSYSGNNAPGSQLLFVLQPAADYFVIQGLSIGAQLLYEHISENAPSGSNGQSTNVDVFGVGPRVGYNVTISDSFSFWPRASFAYTTLNSSAGGTTIGQNAVTVGLFAPFLYHPAPHFFLGLGPSVSTALSASQSQGNQSQDAPKLTTYGIMFTLGGWVGLGG